MVLVIAIVIGVGALVLPVPEPIEIEKPEEPDATPVRRPPTPKAGPRSKQQPVAKPKPPAPVAPKPKSFPLQDTTKQRLTNPPKPRG